MFNWLLIVVSAPAIIALSEVSLSALKIPSHRYQYPGQSLKYDTCRNLLFIPQVMHSGSFPSMRGRRYIVYFILCSSPDIIIDFGHHVTQKARQEGFGSVYSFVLRALAGNLVCLVIATDSMVGGAPHQWTSELITDDLVECWSQSDVP